MGTKVESKSYLPGYYLMRDLNEESSSCGWPLFYGDKTLTNGQYYNGYFSRATSDSSSGYDKDILKRTMLEHEAIFKNQVYELHRLYRIQRDLMDEVKRKEPQRNQMSAEISFSLPLTSQIMSGDAQKWHIPSLPLANSACAQPSLSGFEGIHTPLSSSKRNCTQVGLVPSQNGCTSKDIGVLEPRPTKVRRKMFDLHLPADAYIDSDESEKISDEKMSGTSTYHPERNCVIGHDHRSKIFPGENMKAVGQEDTSRSEQCSRNTNGLADLNEPVQVEETNTSAYVDLLGHASYQKEIECPDLSTKLKSPSSGLAKEFSLNSHHGSDKRVQNDGYLENIMSESGQVYHMLDAGSDKINLKYASGGLQPEKRPLSTQEMQDDLNKVHGPQPFYTNHQSKVNLGGENTVCDLESNDRSSHQSSNKQSEFVVSSQGHSLFSFSPSDLAKSWSHSMSSWDIPSQKSMSVQMQPCLNMPAISGKNSHPCQSNGIIANSWPLRSNTKPNPTFGCDVPRRNGLVQGSSLGSKEIQVKLSSSSYGYLRYSDDHAGVSEQLNSYESRYFKGSHCIDKPAKDVDLNVVLSNGASEKVASQTCLGITGSEPMKEEHATVLPWLRPKATSNSNIPNVGKPSVSGGLNFLRAPVICNKGENRKGPDGSFVHNMMSVSCSNDAEARTEVADCSSNKKILGFPIYEKPNISKMESSSEGEVVENNRRKIILDINLPCDSEETLPEVPIAEKESDTKDVNVRHHIDLNLSMSDDEALMTPVAPRINAKRTTEIDLEAPAVFETEEDFVLDKTDSSSLLASCQSLQQKAEKLHDELVIDAAEAIVAISSSAFCDELVNAVSDSSESTIRDPLSWFVDIVSSCVDDPKCMLDDVFTGKDGEYNEGFSSEESDYFASMTLKLTETKEEDYMPKALVPENLKVEETEPTLLPTRARRGPARRGRQRRDFQRDILPGLASLSRHEVTEDLQTFGGLMRATGHAWNSGLNRRNSTRNGCGRGRRRVVASPSPPVATSTACNPLVQQLNNIEVGLEDRSLTGWGRTTRRPRRQRYPLGNPLPVPLT